MRTTEVKFGPLLAAGTLLGLGLGGFLDSIFFHQILQTHTMLSAKIIPNTLENLKKNMFWDGVFQGFTWCMILAGIIFSWRANLNPCSPKSSRAFVGSMIMGWGLYNTIEGFTNHILLKVHHFIEAVPDSEKIFYDFLYIMSGIFLGIIGRILVTQGKRRFFQFKVKEARLRDFDFKPASTPRIKLISKEYGQQQSD